MKTAVLILALVALATAAPKATKLHFKNLFKHPANEVKVNPSPRIIGGQEAVPHSIPYQAFLEVYSNGQGWYCGASLISPSYVLTAGHCGDGGTQAHVVLGAHSPLRSEDTQVVVESSDITVHADWDEFNIVNDIAVIRLPQPVSLSDVINVVALPRQSDAGTTFAGQTARISGWGLTDGFANQISDVLNYVDVQVISNTECGQAFAENLPDSNICTSGDQSTGSCNGDSGGPLVINGVQVGIVSFGIIYCLPGYPSAFTRTTSFLDWIARNTDVQIS